MIAALKAEFRKILTVRSTYVIIALCLGLLIFFAFYIEGYHQTADIMKTDFLAGEVTSAAGALAVFISLIGLLLVTHEYRYNTIAYTLVASSGRLKVLAAKTIAVSTVALMLALLFCLLSPALAALGLHAKGLTLIAQTFPAVDLLWRSVFYIWGYSMLALIIAVLLRSQVGAISMLLLIPITVEQLLQLLFKDNAVYLPFHALNSVISQSSISYGRAAGVSAVYIVVGWMAAALLFLRRDAN